jgi:hypothetical protein
VSKKLPSVRVGSASFVEPVEDGFVLPGDEVLDRVRGDGVV